MAAAAWRNGGKTKMANHRRHRVTSAHRGGGWRRIGGIGGAYRGAYRPRHRSARRRQQRHRGIIA